MPITTTPSGGPQGEFSTYTPIYSTTLSATATSITFSNIPTTFTDLVIVGNASCGTSDTSLNLNFNSDSGSNYSTTRLYGDGTSPYSDRYTSQTTMNIGIIGSSATAFTAFTINIMNYSNATTYKTSIARSSYASAYVAAYNGLWRNTAPITSIDIKATGQNFRVNSTFTLYGIKAAVTAPKATGGDLVYTDNTYWYHVFKNSGIFDVKTAMNVDYLVVAGGGGGTATGGGGAGGLRSTVTATGGGGSLESQLSVTPIQYSVTVGAGGATGLSGPSNYVGVNGNNSTFASITSVGGGGGAYEGSGTAGGSGGGAGTQAPAANFSGGAGTANQGYAGGGTSGSKDRSAGGGGGAGAVGETNTSSQNGAGGGAGVYVSITGSSVGYAGGGGGGGRTSRTNGAGINYGGGSGGTYPSPLATNATVNTGGGGGGGWENAGMGGSGIVVVRYAV